jgi:RNA polymerase sigma factor (sigma-70 family)
MWESETDVELLRASRRDPEAFRVVYQRHAGEVFRWLCGATNSRSLAEELTAETFALAWRTRRRFVDQGHGTALPWLRGIAANAVRAQLRGQARDSAAQRKLGIALERDAEDANLSRLVDIGEARAQRDALRAGIAALPAAQSRAVALRVLGERSYKEIGERERCAPGLARVRVTRGLAALRRSLRQEDDR